MLLLVCKYRIGTSDTVFVNKTFERNSSPGTGTPWFLARVMGQGKARRFYLEGASLTAKEALDAGIVDRVTEPDSIEEESLAIAERFAAYSPEALESMMKAMHLVDLDFATYLEEAGTGFERLPAPKS